MFTVGLVLIATAAVAFAQGGGEPENMISVLGSDISRDRVAIPTDWGEPLTKPLRIQAAYNDQDIFFRFTFPSKNPGIHHDYVVYEGGKWVRHGKSLVGSVPDGLYEDRLAFHVDDGAVRGFSTQGCWAACHSDLRDPFMYAAPTKDQVKANSYFAQVKKKDDTRHYIPDSRQRGTWWDFAWDDITAEDAEAIQTLMEGGVFLDQWHWRAARGNPIGVSDDMWVLDYRNGDAGKSSYSTNWDGDLEQPKKMFDPDKVGFAALSFEDVRNARVPFDSIYYLSDETMKDFDPNHAWKEGDAVPRRYLRTPEGSRSDISANARWDDGQWTVELKRKLDTGNADDKAFHDRGTYNTAFAFYTAATGNRFHYVTFPQKLGLGQPADIVARKFTGDRPDWAAVNPVELIAFYPGQVSWQFITSDEHPGAPAIRNDSASCASCHTAESLAERAVGLELRDEWEGPRPLTWLAGLLGIIGIASSGILLRRI
jgi:hypothetical protein